MRLEALVVDWGGVLTTSLTETMSAWCTEEGLDLRHFGRVMRELLGSDAPQDNPVHALERGELEVPHFEEQLAARLRSLDGEPVVADGLLSRMFSGFRRAEGMVGVVRTARESGLRTALLSNSWGLDYPRDDWHQLFDVAVVSGEVGMRKPDVDIYLHTAAELGLPPQACVMVDDLPPNVAGAAAAGMVGVLHRDLETTVTELEALFARRLRPAAVTSPGREQSLPASNLGGWPTA